MKKTKKKWKIQYFILSIALLLSMGGGIYQSDIIAKADSTVYVTRTGEKYHTHRCGNGTYYASSLSSAKASGLTACSKCFGGSSYGSNGGGSAYSGSSDKTSRIKPIKINKTSVLLVKGQSTKLKIRNATTKVRWKSSKNAVVSVTENGKIKAKKSGKAIITATVGNRSKKCKVVVENPKLNYKNVELEPTESKKLQLLGCKHSVKWTSSDSSIVKVKKGKITAKDVGTATIKASSHGKKYSCRVLVNKPVLEKVELEQTTLQMEYERTQKIKIISSPSNSVKYYDVSVNSSDSSVISVKTEGNYIILESFKKSGNVEIVITVEGFSAKCQVEVIPRKINSLKLNKASLTLKPDGSESIYYTDNPSDASEYYKAVWTSSDESVVKVTTDGEYLENYATIKAVGEGEADVTLTMGTTIVTCHVVVKETDSLE